MESGKVVLSVGQCRPDQAAITHFLTSHFGVQVITADHYEDALMAVRDTSVDLVLINRKLDADYSDGLEILVALKADPATSGIPVMLVSNFAEWQEKAIQKGAVSGFGKAELASPATREKLAAILNA